MPGRSGFGTLCSFNIYPAMVVCRGGQDEVDNKSTITALQYKFCPYISVVALYKQVQGMMLSSQHIDACFVILRCVKKTKKRPEYKSKKQINASFKVLTQLGLPDLGDGNQRNH